MRIAILSLIVLVSCFSFSCNKDKDPEPTTSINHVGEKWNIVSVEYNLVDQNLTGGSMVADNGKATNAGAFYFTSGKGSFDITIKNTHKEDVYGYTESGSDLTITSISQTVAGASFSQNVIALSGNKTSSTAMTVTGTITKQSLTGQFVLTGTFTLQKN